MRVKELMQVLKTVDPEAEVMICTSVDNNRIILPCMEWDADTFPNGPIPGGAKDWFELSSCQAWGQPPRLKKRRITANGLLRVAEHMAKQPCHRTMFVGCGCEPIAENHKKNGDGKTCSEADIPRHLYCIPCVSRIELDSIRREVARDPEREVKKP